jgi:cell division protease FtsH
MSSRPTGSTRAAPPRTLQGLVVSALVLMIVLAWSLTALGPNTPGQEVTIGEAKQAIAGGQVASATIYEEDARIVLERVDGSTLWAAYTDDGGSAATLIGELTGAGATVRVEQQWGRRTLAIFAQFILPLLLLANLFGIFILLSRSGSSQVRDLFSFSGIGAKRAQSGTANPYRFADVAAAGDAIVELNEIADYLRSPARFAAMGALPPKGVLLYGPPGCGKTLLARALAGEVGVPFYFISGSEFVESLVGVGAARVRDLFRQAVLTAPAIIFIDELDAAGRRRGAGVGGGNDEREQTLNEMLVQMDGFAPNLGVVVIAATNRPDVLDPALLRPGRFDRQIIVEAPDAEGRADILELHAGSRRLAADVDLDLIARATPGCSGADLANVVNEAALLAVRAGASMIRRDDLSEAVARVLSGPRRQGRLLTEDEIRRLAYHEAGHVVVASAVDYPADIHRVSIVSRGAQAGRTNLPRSDRVLLTQTELAAEMTLTMGGVAAEVVVTGEPSTAVEDDLHRATELARDYAGRFGMADEVGRIRILEPDAEVFLGRDLATSARASDRTMESLDIAVSRLVTEAERQAVEIVRKRRPLLDAIAEALITKESLDEDEINDLLRAPAARRKART